MSRSHESGLSVWSEHELASGEPKRFPVGPLLVHAVFRKDEIWIAHDRREDVTLPGRVMEPATLRSPARSGSGGGEAPDPPEEGDAEWTRWALPRERSGIRLTPVFPDRPLVVEPEQPFHLVQGARARVYIRVPLWVRVELPDPGTTTLTEIPTTLLSDTWFGEVTEGELAYYLPTSARRSLSPELFEPDRVICPLQLSNRSAEPLAVEKIALRVSHLSVYRRGRELWANETRVRYEGEAVGSSIEMSPTAPEEAPDAERMSQPRQPLERSFTARTFSRLKHVPGLGLPFS